MIIVLVSGGFDPVHSGHINYLTSAKALGDKLIVGLNSDAWLTRKKSRPFMPMNERKSVIASIGVVDEVIEFDDNDGSSCQAITKVREMYPDARIIFANGGDRNSNNTPEMRMSYHDDDLRFAYSIGGDSKANSSSWLLEDWKHAKTERTWGYYRVLHQDGKQVKLKELTVAPGQKLSMQKHEKRSEFWFVTTGVATVYTLDVSSDIELSGVFGKNEHLWIRRGNWHQLANEGTEELRMIEIQYGDDCVEEDIVRK